MSLSRFAGLALITVILGSCSDPSLVDTSSASDEVGDVAPSLSVVPALPAVCGDRTSVRLIADETLPVGTVEVAQSGTHLYVAYRTGPDWPIARTALFVGSSADEIPATASGNPQIGHFPHRSSHPGLNEVVWELSLESLSGTSLALAAFAEVGGELEGAWGEGEAIGDGGSWAMYLSHTVASCAAVTVDESGGTVTSPDARASLTIPQDALSEPTDITIEPATVDDLSGKEPPATALGPALTTVFGVTPVEGTVWDLGPDGLEFLTPATLTLTYDEQRIPEGASEDDLGVYVINGIFEKVPSTTDTETSTITAEIAHFTYAFVGVDLSVTSADLEVTGLPVPQAPQVGVPIDIAAQVRNNGLSGSVIGAMLLYEALGPVDLGEVAESCEEIADPGFGDVAVSCSVGDLGPGASVTSPPLTMVPLEAGPTITVRATVVAPEGVEDPNVGNNVRQIDFSFHEVDLAPADPIVTRVGETVSFRIRVGNLLPPSNGGAVVYEAVGDVELGSIADGCVQLDPEAVRVECSFGPFATTVSDEFVGPFEFSVQSEASIQLSADVIPVAGDTDLNPADNLFQGVLYKRVDLGVTLSTNESTVEVDQGIEATATVQNLGPDDSLGSTVTFLVTGAVDLGEIEGNCAEIPDSDPYSVVVSCEVPPLFTGHVDRSSWIQLTPAQEGDVIIQALVRALDPVDEDPVRENNSETVVVSVGPGG